MALALRERLGRLHETAAAVGILFEIHVRFPSAYPGSPEGTTGTSSLGFFWRQDLGKTPDRATRFSHPLTLFYMGAALAGKRGGSADVATKCATQAARDPHLDPPPFRGRKQQA
jgi:hypothetical protein